MTAVICNLVSFVRQQPPLTLGFRTFNQLQQVTTITKAQHVMLQNEEVLMHANNELMKYSVLRIISRLYATTVSEQISLKELVTMHIQISN